MKALRRCIVLGVFAVAAAAACGGNTESAESESNTNWMQSCTSDADCGLLSCECGVCSRACDSAAACSSLGTSTACAESFPGCVSGEPGVCVPRCESDEDCPAFGSSCEDGACGAGVSAGVDGGSDGSVSEDAAQPRASDGSASASRAIEPCPGGAPESDPFDVNRFEIDGHTLTIETHGGCVPDEFTLCYLGPFPSAPPIVAVSPTYDSTQLCDPPQDLTLAFDLRPIVDRTFPGMQSGLLSVSVFSRYKDGKEVSHGGDFYHWGDLNCFDRQFLARSRALDAVQRADRTCSTNDDCRWVSADTLCSRHCGAALSNSGAGDLAAALDGISEAVCGDYEADECEPEPETAPCPEPPTVACIEGACAPEP